MRRRSRCGTIEAMPRVSHAAHRLSHSARRIARVEEAIAARPGERFVARYEARRAERGRARRPSRILLAAGLFTIGMLNVFVPGPGGSVFIFASALVLSAESRSFARLLDRGELRYLPQVRWALAHPVVMSTTITLTILATLVLVAR